MIQIGLIASPLRKKKHDDSAERNFAFACRALKLPKLSEQFRFALPIGRRWAADFAFVEYHLLIEIDGGIRMPGGGAHSRPQNIERDMEKQNAAVLLGWSTLRFTPAEVKRGYAVDFVSRVLSQRGWKP